MFLAASASVDNAKQRQTVQAKKALLRLDATGTYLTLNTSTSLGNQDSSIINSRSAPPMLLLHPLDGVDYASSARQSSRHVEQQQQQWTDALVELQRERAETAALEQRLAQLELQLQQHRQFPPPDGPAMPSDDEDNDHGDDHQADCIVSLQTQVQGYRQIVDALTQERPAVAQAATADNHQTCAALSLDTIRWLEVVPWCEALQQHVYHDDDLYEWEVFQHGQWRSQVADFPEFFQALPSVVSPHQEDEDDNKEEQRRNQQQAKEQEQQVDVDASVKDKDNSEEQGMDNSSIRHLDKEWDSVQKQFERLDISDTGILASSPTATAANTRGAFLELFFSGIDSPPSSPSNQKQHHQPTEHKVSTNKPPRQSLTRDAAVLTNANLTHRYVFPDKKGFPLPRGATWRWISPWSIDKPSPHEWAEAAKNMSKVLQKGGNEENEASNLQQNHKLKNIINFFDNDDQINNHNNTHPDTGFSCDQDGWTYARQASHFLQSNAHQLCWASDITTTTTTTTTTTNLTGCQAGEPPLFRRRRWTRPRVLMDYPQASEASQEYLNLVAQNASLTLASREMQDKLEETQTALTQATLAARWAETRHTAEWARLQHAWKHRDQILKRLRFGKFKRKVERLSCHEQDLRPILESPKLFQQLQRDLRQSGAITNGMLQQGIHFYIYDHFRNHSKAAKRSGSGRSTRHPATANSENDASKIMPARTAKSTELLLERHNQERRLLV